MKITKPIKRLFKGNLLQCTRRVKLIEGTVIKPNDVCVLLDNWVSLSAARFGEFREDYAAIPTMIRICNFTQRKMHNANKALDVPNLFQVNSTNKEKTGS